MYTRVASEEATATITNKKVRSLLLEKSDAAVRSAFPKAIPIWISTWSNKKFMSFNGHGSF